MAWFDDKIQDDPISSQMWNSAVDILLWVSGSYVGHSSNALIHSPSSNLKTWFDTLYKDSGAVSGYWSQTGSDIYYTDGEVRVGDSVDYGDYQFQVSGDTILSGNVTFIGELSGLADPTYASGAANKNYVDTISGNLNWRFVASSTALSKFYNSTAGYSNYLHSSNNNIHIKGVSAPKSGQVPVYGADIANATWQNVLPPMTFNISNVEISANHNINITRFDVSGKKVYVWQAAACNSGGAMVGGLQIELLSGSTSVYSTSSATIQQGYPLAVSNGGDTEIRFMYSSNEILSGYQYGTAFMNVSVY